MFSWIISGLCTCAVRLTRRALCQTTLATCRSRCRLQTGGVCSSNLCREAHASRLCQAGRLSQVGRSNQPGGQVGWRWRRWRAHRGRLSLCTEGGSPGSTIESNRKGNPKGIQWSARESINPIKNISVLRYATAIPNRLTRGNQLVTRVTNLPHGYPFVLVSNHLTHSCGLPRGLVANHSVPTEAGPRDTFGYPA